MRMLALVLFVLVAGCSKTEEPASSAPVAAPVVERNAGAATPPAPSSSAEAQPAASTGALPGGEAIGATLECRNWKASDGITQRGFREVKLEGLAIVAQGVLAMPGVTSSGADNDYGGYETKVSLPAPVSVYGAPTQNFVLTLYDGTATQSVTLPMGVIQAKDLVSKALGVELKEDQDRGLWDHQDDLQFVMVGPGEKENESVLTCGFN